MRILRITLKFCLTVIIIFYMALAVMWAVVSFVPAVLLAVCLGEPRGKKIVQRILVLPSTWIEPAIRYAKSL